MFKRTKKMLLLMACVGLIMGGFTQAQGMTPSAAMVVKPDDLSAGFDQAMHDRLVAMGYSVTLVAQDAVGSAFTIDDANGYDLLLVSESISSKGADPLIGTTTPTMHNESYGWDNWFLTTPTKMGWTTGTSVDIVTDAHPIAAIAGIHPGPMAFFSAEAAWTTELASAVAPGAKLLAKTAVDGNDLAVVFVIEKGAELANGNAAPARIAGFSIPADNVYDANAMTDEAWGLFDATVQWLNPPAPQVPPMVAHWAMDEGDGTVVADAVGGHDGTMVGNVSWIEGAMGGAVTFDETDPNAAIVIPHAAELDFGDVDFSISIWVRYPVVPADAEHQLIMKGSFGSPDSGSRYTLFNKNGELRFEIDNGPANIKSGIRIDNTPVVSGEWVHVVLVRDAANDLLAMYVDGALATSGTESSGDISSGEEMRIGNTTVGNGRTCEADIDDVRIFAQALTEDEIAAIASLCGSPIEVAGELLVDVSAADPSAGTATWVNNGTLGDFNFVTAENMPAESKAMTPGTLGEHLIVTEFEGVPVVDVNSTSAHLVAYVGPMSVPGIEGDSDRTIEAWVADDDIPKNQTIVAWSRRGGPDGTSMAFQYGYKTTYGAMIHWADPFDSAWTNTLDGDVAEELPTPGTLHHLVYTYADNTIKLYRDGQLVVTRTTGVFKDEGEPAPLNTHAGQTINLFVQNDNASGGLSNNGLPVGLLVNSIRVHDGALTDAQVLNNYLVGPAGSD